MKKFFLVGGYCGGNPGDEAILKSTVRSLEDLFPNSHFYIWVDQRFCNIQFERSISWNFVYWQALDGIFADNVVSKTVVKLYSDFFPASKKFFKFFLRPSAAFVQALNDSDSVIFTGGGYLNSDYRLIQMNFLLDEVRKAGKRILLLGQTLGPFQKKTHRRMADEIFTAAEKIVLRERHSEVEVADFKEKVIFGVDDAIGFNPPLAASVRAAVKKYFVNGNGGGPPLYVGVNLRRCADSRNYYRSFAQAIESFVRSLNGVKVKVFFIPMETSPACDDREEGAEFAKHMSSVCECVVIKENLSVEAKFYFIRKMDLILSMRLHCLIFSLAAGIPVIGLYNDEYYFRKISGILRSFGADKSLLSFRRIHHLPKMICDTFENRESLRQKILTARNGLMEARQTLFNQLLGAPS